MGGLGISGGNPCENALVGDRTSSLSIFNPPLALEYPYITQLKAFRLSILTDD